MDKQPISFISKLFTRFTRHPELQDVTFSSRFENPLPFHRCCKKKKKKSDSNWRSSVSFFKTPECCGRLYLSSWLTEFLSQVGGAPQQGVGLSVFLSDQRGSLSHWYLNNVTLRGSFGQCFFFILHLEFYTHQIIAKCGFLVCVDFSYPNHIHVTAVAPLFGMSPAFCLGWSRGRLLVFWITVFCVVFTLLHVCFECLHANFPPAAVLCRRMQNVIHITDYGSADFWMICETIKIDDSMIWINIKHILYKNTVHAVQ